MHFSALLAKHSPFRKFGSGWLHHSYWQYSGLANISIAEKCLVKNYFSVSVCFCLSISPLKISLGMNYFNMGGTVKIVTLREPLQVISS